MPQRHPENPQALYTITIGISSTDKNASVENLLKAVKALLQVNFEKPLHLVRDQRLLSLTREGEVQTELELTYVGSDPPKIV